MVQLLSKYSQEEIAIGLSIGDGYIRYNKGSLHAYLEITHSVKQYEYLIIKSNIALNCLNINYSMSNRIIKNGKHTYYAFRSTFNSSPIFDNVYDILYDNGKRSLYKVLPYLNDYILAMLFMDDGSSKIKKRVKRKNGDIMLSSTGYVDSFMIALNRYSYEECKQFCEVLKNKFDIDASVQKDRGLPRVAISNLKSKLNFLNLIVPFTDCVNDMRYKTSMPISMSEANFVNIGKTEGDKV